MRRAMCAYSSGSIRLYCLRQCSHASYITLAEGEGIGVLIA